MKMRPGRGLVSTFGLTALMVAVTSGCGADSSGSNDAGSGSVAEGATPSALPPWPAPVGNVPALVEEAGLDLGPMGTAEHYHPTLRIVVNGEQIPIPPNVGVDVTTGAMSAVHTHEGDGTIHIEADKVGEVFTLGQLFTQWGVSLGEDHIGGVRASNGVSVTSNGSPVKGNPADLQFRPEQDIVLELS